MDISEDKIALVEGMDPRLVARIDALQAEVAALRERVGQLESNMGQRLLAEEGHARRIETLDEALEKLAHTPVKGWWTRVEVLEEAIERHDEQVGQLQQAELERAYDRAKEAP